MHMLEAGVPMMAIKNFLGHTSVTTTKRYAGLTQSAINQQIKEWNQHWFSANIISHITDEELRKTSNHLPSFLK